MGGDGQGGAVDEKRRERGSMMVEGLVELRNYTIKKTFSIRGMMFFSSLLIKRLWGFEKSCWEGGGVGFGADTHTLI